MARHVLIYVVMPGGCMFVEELYMINPVNIIVKLYQLLRIKYFRNKPNFKARVDNDFQRGVKEAIIIRQTRTNMNRDDGRYKLSHVYDNLLRPSVTGGWGSFARKTPTYFCS